VKFTYECSECGRHYEIRPDIMVCPRCSKKQGSRKPLRGILEVSLEGELNGGFDIHALMPVDRKYFPNIPVGNTPLWTPTVIRRDLDLPKLYIKDDTLNPTGSLKDRASFLVAAYAIQHGIEDIVVASTGNAGSSMAGVGAAAGLHVTLFIPESAPRAKMVQALQYGAEVISVRGTYDRAYDLSCEYTTIRGGLNRSTAYNPLTIEGKKSVALEIYQQLGRAPDYIYIPVGDGVILAGVYKGFRDLKRLGFIERIPTVYAVQAERSDAIYRACERGDYDVPVKADTIADSICVDVPRNGYFAVKLLTEYGGRCITVSDDAILKAQNALASSTGLFAEPAGAASFAGLLSSRHDIPKDAVVVILVTGNGLKDIDAAMKNLTLPGEPISSLEDILS
jgi:threonine synthase